jgi:hypothetical protein
MINTVSGFERENVKESAIKFELLLVQPVNEIKRLRGS